MFTSKIVIDYDDLHWKDPENCLSTIQEIVNNVPDIKLTFFTTSLHSNIPIKLQKTWCNKIRKFINNNNICLAIHGLRHEILQFKNISYNDALNKIQLAQKNFEQAELPFIKIFKGPHWGINENTYNRLIDLGYTHVYSHEQYKHLQNIFPKIKTIYYNWNLAESPLYNDIIVAHGHTHDVCNNGILQTKNKLINFIKNNKLQFKFGNEI